MSLIDLILTAAILLAVALAVKSIRRQRKKGGCCGDCSSCSGCKYGCKPQ